MAEDPVLGKATAQGPLERVDVVDAFADERAFGEHVLVDVGNGACVRIDARITRVHAREPRSIRARQADAHAWLQYAVPLGHPLGARWHAGAIETRTVQRVCHHADELPRRVARQLRVGVERDHVLHVRQRRGVPDDEREGVRGAAAQEGIQVCELAALALVTHPDPLLRIPAPRAVKEKEGVT